MRIAIAILVVALVLVAGCAKQAMDDTHQVTDSSEQTTTTANTATSDTLSQADQLLLNEGDTVEIGEML